MLSELVRIKPTYVSSSNLDAIAYHRGDLYIRFKHGGVYAYQKVPFAIYTELEKSESVGKAFHALIRDNYAFSKLDSDPFSE